MSAAMQAPRYTGKVKWFDPEKAYGFIIPNGPIPNHSGDVFLHIRHIEGKWDPVGGQQVSFEVGITKGRPHAEAIRPA